MDIELMDAILTGPASNLTGLAAGFACLASRPDSIRAAASHRPRAKDVLARLEQKG